MSNTAVRIVYFADDARDGLITTADAYLARCRQRFDADALGLKPAKRRKKSDDNQTKADEAQRLIAATADRTRIVLDAGGEMMSSEKWAQRIERWLSTRRIALCIGGASGWHERVKSEADHIVSLSPMTLPHRLALLVCAEQVFRAHEILRGGPYHK